MWLAKDYKAGFTIICMSHYPVVVCPVATSRGYNHLWHDATGQCDIIVNPAKQTKCPPGVGDLKVETETVLHRTEPKLEALR